MTYSNPSDRAVRVVWVDSANLFGDRWASRDDLKEHHSETYCDTLGWLVDETEHSIYVAGSLAPYEIGSVMQIPRVAIKEIKELDIYGKADERAAEEAAEGGVRWPE